MAVGPGLGGHHPVRPVHRTHTRQVPTDETPAPPPPQRRPLVTFSPAVALVTACGLIVGVVLFLAVVNSVSSGDARSPVGTNLYVLGGAKALAPSIDERGPLLLQDPLGSKRAIYIQHLEGNDWRTFDTRPPDAASGCLVVWEPARRVFVDQCAKERSYPADGTGLTSFPTRVDEDGKVLIDLRSPQPPATTTTAPAPAPAETTTTLPAEPVTTGPQG